MKSLHHVYCLALAFLIVLIFPGFAPAQMSAPSGKTPVVVPYYCPVDAPVPADNPADSKPLGIGPLSTGGNTLSPLVDFDFTNPVDIYVAVSAYSDPDNYWVLEPDGQFLSLGDNDLVPWETNVYTLKKGLLGSDMSAAGLPVDTYYLYLAVTPLGKQLSTQGPYDLWQSSLTVMPSYLSINPSCLQIQSSVGDSNAKSVTISNPSGSNVSYTITSIDVPSGQGFSLSQNTCENKNMQPGSSCSFSVAFTPSEEGQGPPVSLSIGIEDVAGNTGGAQGAASVAPASVSIPVVGVGTQASVSCQPTLPSTSETLDSNSQQSSFSVSYPSGCTDTWTATTSADWITIDHGSDTGSGTVTYSVTANTGTSGRSAAISVAGQTFTVTQKAPVNPGTCTYTLSSTKSQTFPSSGGTGQIQLTTQAGCEWDVAISLDSTWVTITSNRRNNTGSGAITYTVASNSGSTQRSGSLTVTGGNGAVHTYDVVQSGGGCTYNISPGSATFGADGGNGSFTVSATGSACTAPSLLSDDWIHITGTSGTYTVSYTVDANTTGASRSGTITVAGTKIFQISQSASSGSTGCTYTLSSTGNSVGANGVASASFTVTATGSDCSWSASTTSSWITINSPTVAQTSSGSVNYSVSANTGSSRGGYINVGDQRFSITQSGVSSSSISYKTIPTNEVEYYSLSGKNTSGTPPISGRDSMFFQVTVPAEGCPQIDQLQFWITGMTQEVNMLVADPDHEFSDLDSAFDLYNTDLSTYYAVGPPYWWRFQGGATTESVNVTKVNESNYGGKTFYVMIVNEGTSSSPFRIEANCY